MPRPFPCYLGVFGLGSILGMALFSTVTSLPLRFSARHLGWAFSGLEAVLGVVNSVLDGFIVFVLFSCMPYRDMV